MLTRELGVHTRASLQAAGAIQGAQSHPVLWHDRVRQINNAQLVAVRLKLTAKDVAG